MHISRTRIGCIEIRPVPDSEDHVSIGVTQIAFLIDGDRYNRGSIGKPHNEFTMGELERLYASFVELRRVRYRNMVPELTAC